MTKNLYVHGSFMNDNFGDFLLYEALMNELKHYEDEYTIFSADVSETYDKYCKVNRKNKIAAVLSADKAIFGGGGYFGEPDRLKFYWSIKFLKNHGIPLVILRLRKVPYAIVGVGVGPLSYFLPRSITKFIFNGAKKISVRDEESKKYLASIGVKKEIDVIPDWVMSMDEKNLVKEEITEEIQSKISFNNPYKIIFVHLTTRNHKDGQGLSLVINELIEFANKNKGFAFIIGCDQARQTQTERASEILSMMPPDRAKLLPYMGPRVLCYAINKSDIVITDKLHVGIVGTRLNKKVLAFASHSKTLRFYRQINRSKSTSHLKELDKTSVREMFKTLEVSDSNSINEIVDHAKKIKRL